MTAFEHPIWRHLAPYARVSEGRDNVDLLELPDQLLALAIDVLVNCVACGRPIHPFRRREKSERARTAGAAEERRLYYAATCPSEVNAGCARTTSAKQHKDLARRLIARRVA